MALLRAFVSEFSSFDLFCMVSSLIVMETTSCSPLTTTVIPASVASMCVFLSSFLIVRACCWNLYISLSFSNIGFGLRTDNFNYSRAWGTTVTRFASYTIDFSLSLQVLSATMHALTSAKFKIMDTFVLEAEKRDLAQKASALRRLMRLPGVLYGEGVDPQAISLDYNAFRKIFAKAGESTLIDLKVAGGKDAKVLVYDVQYHPVTGKVEHVDFLNVRMDKEVEAKIRVEITGSAPAVRDFGAVLSTVLHEIEIKCLPKDLVQSVKVDVSSLVQFHEAIRVKDLSIPSGIKVLNAPEEIVVTVLPPRKEEEVAPVPAAAVPVVGEEAVPAIAQAVPAEGEKK